MKEGVYITPRRGEDGAVAARSSNLREGGNPMACMLTRGLFRWADCRLYVLRFLYMDG